MEGRVEKTHMNASKGEPVSGLRFNKGKPPYHLVSPFALEGLAKVLGFGAQKYAARNWEKGFSFEETLRSLLSHAYALQRGERIDPESGLPHIDHLGCNWMFLSHFMKLEQYKAHDDLKGPR